MLKKLHRCEKGAVTIYFMIIFTALFLFNALFIDLIRIKLAERETEKAVKAAVRSAMSAFDGNLKAYGLFGLTRDPGKVQEIYNEVFEKNATVDHSAFSLTNIQPGSNQNVQYLFSLANHSVIQRQILEEMKYVAPIEIGRSLTDKLSSAQVMTQTAATFQEQAEQMENLLQQREKHLNEAWKSVEDLRALLADANDRYQRDANTLNGLSAEIGHIDKEKLIKDIKDLDDEIDESENPSQAKKKRLKKLKQQLKDIEKYDDVLAGLKQRANNDLPKTDQIKTKIITHLNEAQKMDEQVRLTKQKIAAEHSSTSGSDPMFQVFQTTHEYGDPYFTQYKQSIERVFTLCEDGNKRLQAIEDRNQRVQIDGNAITELNAFFDRQKSQENERTLRNQNLDNRKAEAKKEAQNAMKQTANRLFHHCRNEDFTHYHKMTGPDGYSRKYSEHNRQSDELGEPTAYDNAEETAEFGFSLVDQAMKLTQSLRDEIYLNEYALTNFNYFTFDVDARTDYKATLSEPALHPLKNQEVEYILYGQNSCHVNLSAAYGEMFVVRLAIRTAEALFDPAIRASAAGSPWLMFLLALARGATIAYDDMEKLQRGEAVELTNKLPNVKLNYKDYLRFLLLIHSNNRGMLSRLQALIHLNTGVDLTGAYTYIRGGSTVSLQLWFLPQIRRMVGNASSEGGGSNNTASMSATADFSY